jgi:hypothetical protein
MPRNLQYSDTQACCMNAHICNHIGKCTRVQRTYKHTHTNTHIYTHDHKHMRTHTWCQQAGRPGTMIQRVGWVAKAMLQGGRLKRCPFHPFFKLNLNCLVYYISMQCTFQKIWYRYSCFGNWFERKLSAQMLCIWFALILCNWFERQLSAQALCNWFALILCNWLKRKLSALMLCLHVFAWFETPVWYPSCLSCILCVWCKRCVCNK